MSVCPCVRNLTLNMSETKRFRASLDMFHVYVHDHDALCDAIRKQTINKVNVKNLANAKVNARQQCVYEGP